MLKLLLLRFPYERMRLILLFLLFHSFGFVYGQNKHSYVLISTGLDKKQSKYLNNISDSILFKKRLQAIQSQHQKKGFVLANVDELRFDSLKQVTLVYYKGPKLNGLKINVQPSDAKILRKWAGLSEQILSNQTLTPLELQQLYKRILSAYTNNGYAFAKIKLDIFKIDSISVEGDLLVEKGPLLYWNDIHLKGDSSLPKKFIANTIQFKKGDPFSEERFLNVSRKLIALNLYEEIKPSELLFTEKGVDLYVYLIAKKLSSVNGIIGLQPNSITGKMQLTGDINLKLNNILKRGEYLGINWSSLQAKTQQLKTAIKYPYILNTPLGFEGSFNLYKRDTTFLELSGNAGISYNISGNFYFKAFYENFSSSVLNGGNPYLNNFGTTKTNLYGVGVNYNNYDYIPLPTRGIGIISSFSTGIRKAYNFIDSTWSKNTVYKGELMIDWYIPVAKRHVVKLSNMTQLYEAPKFYSNEAYRFGGLQSQRGFNEQFLLATARTTFSAEYRFMIERTTYLYVFYDQSWYENNTGKYYKDYPLGFGAGFTFGTPIGMFSLSYALGKTTTEDLKFRNGKIHFGYIALF